MGSNQNQLKVNEKPDCKLTFWKEDIRNLKKKNENLKLKLWIWKKGEIKFEWINKFKNEIVNLKKGNLKEIKKCWKKTIIKRKNKLQTITKEIKFLRVFLPFFFRFSLFAFSSLFLSDWSAADWAFIAVKWSKLSKILDCAADQMWIHPNHLVYLKDRHNTGPCRCFLIRHTPVLDKNWTLRMFKSISAGTVLI